MDSSDKCHISEKEKLGYAQFMDVSLKNMKKAANAGNRIGCLFHEVDALGRRRIINSLPAKSTDIWTKIKGASLSPLAGSG
jgi:hypothetical protein